MNAYANVSLIENKLDELLSENHLVHTFRTSSYPVVLTISQDASPEAQVTLFESTDGSVSSRDAKLRLIFELDGLKIQTSSRLVLADALMNKIKGLARKLNSAYKEAFFADRIGVVEDVNPPGEPADDGDDENTTSGEFDGFFDGEGGEPSDES